MKKLSLLTGILCAAASASADITLNAIFADHMVLQRDRSVAVYGSAESGEKVSVALSGQEKTTTADKDGKWLLKLSVGAWVIYVNS